MDPAPANPPDQYDEFVFRRLLDEVYLLMDFISGHPDKHLTDLAGIPIPTENPVPQNQATPEAAPSATQVLAHICQLRYPPTNYRPLNAQNAAFLLLVKDKLNGLAHPALGLTIAFTAMVVGSTREPVFKPDAPVKTKPATRLTLAAEAYPALVTAAATMRWTSLAAICLLLLLTFFTAYTSGVAAFGRATLEQIDEIGRARTAQAEAIHNIEATLPKPQSCTGAACPSPQETAFIRLCDRPGLLKTRLNAHTDVFENPTEQQLCDNWSDLTQKQTLAYHDLGEYEDRYLYLYEWPVIAAANLHRMVVHPIATLSALFHGQSPDPAIDASYSRSEQWVASVLTNLGNFLLPMCFTLLGAGVSIVRGFYDKMSNSTLAPRDLPLSFGRLVLGLMTGAAIGLFYTPGPMPADQAGGLAGSLTLSAQGLAFLAGYSVDGAFEVFDSMIRRLKSKAAPGGSK